MLLNAARAAATSPPEPVETRVKYPPSRKTGRRCRAPAMVTPPLQRAPALDTQPPDSTGTVKTTSPQILTLKVMVTYGGFCHFHSCIISSLWPFFSKLDLLLATLTWLKLFYAGLGPQTRPKEDGCFYFERLREPPMFVWLSRPSVCWSNKREGRVCSPLSSLLPHIQPAPLKSDSRSLFK